MLHFIFTHKTKRNNKKEIRCLIVSRIHMKKCASFRHYPIAMWITYKNFFNFIDLSKRKSFKVRIIAMMKMHHISRLEKPKKLRRRKNTHYSMRKNLKHILIYNENLTINLFLPLWNEWFFVCNSKSSFLRYFIIQPFAFSIEFCYCKV